MTVAALGGGAAHGLSWGLLGFVILVVVRLGIRQGLQQHHQSSPGNWRRTLRIRFAIVGIFLGGTWVWHTHAPLWQRLIRLAVVMLVVVPAVRWVLGRSRGREQVAPKHPVRNWYWFAMKLCLIVLGTLAQLGLEAVMSRTAASWIVGAAVAVAVALGGPPLTAWAVRRRMARQAPSLTRAVPTS
jgi:hypothetical protein